MTGKPLYKFFSAEHSMFSAKVRGYFRFKHDQGDLDAGFEEILATPHLIQNLLQKRSGSPSLPQIETPKKVWIQDTCEIIDYCETVHKKTQVIPTSPKQRLTSYIIELLADEWILVPACWERWQFSLTGQHPNHRTFNEQQWGSFLNPTGTGKARAAAGKQFFQRAFGIDDDKSVPRGPYSGLIDLGCTDQTLDAWQASLKKVLDALELHFAEHDYLLGGRPSLGDFSLLGPMYVHFYRDAVPGFILRTYYPLITEWVERTNAESCLNARRYGQKHYEVSADGELIEKPFLSDHADWLKDDEVPETLETLLEVFFSEMWPYLSNSADALRHFICSDQHEPGAELPRKSFTASPGFERFQQNHGALTVAFNIGGIEATRMVVPYQIWMLQRLNNAMQSMASNSWHDWIVQFKNGAQFIKLNEKLAGVEIEKRGGLLYSLSH
jgi:glutathione S-transferase